MTRRPRVAHLCTAAYVGSGTRGSASTPKMGLIESSGRRCGAAGWRLCAMVMLTLAVVIHRSSPLPVTCSELSVCALLLISSGPRLRGMMPSTQQEVLLLARPCDPSSKVKHGWRTSVRTFALWAPMPAACVSSVRIIHRSLVRDSPHVVALCTRVRRFPLATENLACAKKAQPSALPVHLYRQPPTLPWSRPRSGAQWLLSAMLTMSTVYSIAAFAGAARMRHGAKPL